MWKDLYIAGISLITASAYAQAGSQWLPWAWGAVSLCWAGSSWLAWRTKKLNVEIKRLEER